MKYLKYIPLVFMLLLILSSCTQKREGLVEFNIYAINDLHSNLFPVSYVGGAPKPNSLANVAGFFDSRNEVEKEYLLLDIGDHLQGDNSAYYFNFLDKSGNPHIFSRMMNYIGFDAIVVGNHDIEAGSAIYDRVKEELDSPYLAANAINIHTNKPYFDPYVLVDCQGAKVLIIGMTNENIPAWLPKSMWKDIRFDDPKPILDTMIPNLKERFNPDLVVLAIHSGIGDGKPAKENVAKYLAQSVNGIDIVFAAHDHRKYMETINRPSGNNTLIIEAGSRARYLADVNVKLTFENDKLVSKNITGDYIDLQKIEPSKAFTEEFELDYLNVKEFTNKIIGYNEELITADGVLIGPSTYLQILHSVQKQKANADISISAPLNLNLDIRKGNMTMDDIFKICPFENIIVKIKMYGYEIDAYLERSYASWINTYDPTNNNYLFNVYKSGARYIFANAAYNLDSAFGIDYEVDIKAEEGNKVNIKSFSSGKKFNEKELYTVALSSYRFAGGGDLLHPVITGGKAELEKRGMEEYGDLRAAIIDSLSQMKKIYFAIDENWTFMPKDLAKKVLSKEVKELSL